MTGNEINTELISIINEYSNNLKKEVEYRLANWIFNHNLSAVYQVISGLLSRQASITLEILSAPKILNGLVIAIILRSMIDVYITMAWILRNDSEVRAQKFIDYGLGQEKLMLECRKAELEAIGRDPEQDSFVITSRNLINIIKYKELVDINIGSWSGVSIRQMAVEAGCLDFYNLTYIPFSQDVHSNWPHLIRFNLLPCKNPMHKFHFKGVLKDVNPNFFHNLRNVVKYMNKVLNLFDNYSELDVSHMVSASKILQEKIDSLKKRIKEENNKK